MIFLLFCWRPFICQTEHIAVQRESSHVQTGPTKCLCLPWSRACLQATSKRGATGRSGKAQVIHKGPKWGVGCLGSRGAGSVQARLSAGEGEFFMAEKQSSGAQEASLSFKCASRSRDRLRGLEAHPSNARSMGVGSNCDLKWTLWVHGSQSPPANLPPACALRHENHARASGRIRHGAPPAKALRRSQFGAKKLK